MATNEPLQNKYSLVKGAARRARHLQSNVPAFGISNSLKPCRIALDEIRMGKVTFVVPPKLLPPASL